MIMLQFRLPVHGKLTWNVLSNFSVICKPLYFGYDHALKLLCPHRRKKTLITCTYFFYLNGKRCQTQLYLFVLLRTFTFSCQWCAMVWVDTVLLLRRHAFHSGSLLNNPQPERFNARLARWKKSTSNLSWEVQRSHTEKKMHGSPR